MKKFIDAALANAEQGFRDIRVEPAYLDKIEDIAVALTYSYSIGGKVLICGNGGSHADALHFAEELTGRFRKDRIPLGAIALGESTHATCVTNDYGFEHVFSRQIVALGKPEDVLIVLSTSGNSKNVIAALDAASSVGMCCTVALLGKDGGEISNSSKADIELIVPGQTSDRIQELHMFLLHMLVELIERELFPENYV